MSERISKSAVSQHFWALIFSKHRPIGTHPTFVTTSFLETRTKLFPTGFPDPYYTVLEPPCKRFLKPLPGQIEFLFLTLSSQGEVNPPNI